MHDLRHLPCRAVLLRLQALGVCVHPVDGYSGADGSVIFLTLADRYYPLAYFGDDATVYAQELEAILARLRIDRHEFMEGIDMPPDE